MAVKDQVFEAAQDQVFEAVQAVAHPKDKAKAQAENQETGEPSGGAGFPEDKAKSEVLMPELEGDSLDYGSSSSALVPERRGGSLDYGSFRLRSEQILDLRRRQRLREAEMDQRDAAAVEREQRLCAAELGSLLRMQWLRDNKPVPDKDKAKATTTGEPPGGPGGVAGRLGKGKEFEDKAGQKTTTGEPPGGPELAVAGDATRRGLFGLLRRLLLLAPLLLLLLGLAIGRLLEPGGGLQVAGNLEAELDHPLRPREAPARQGLQARLRARLRARLQARLELLELVEAAREPRAQAGVHVPKVGRWAKAKREAKAYGGPGTGSPRNGRDVRLCFWTSAT